MKVIKLKESDIKRIVKRVLTEGNNSEDCMNKIRKDIRDNNLSNVEDFCVNHIKSGSLNMSLINRMLKWLKDKKGVDLTLCDLCDKKIKKSEEVMNTVNGILNTK